MNPRALALALLVASFAAWQVAARVSPHLHTGPARAGSAAAAGQSGFGPLSPAKPVHAAGAYTLNRPDTVLVWQAHRYVRGSSGSVTYFTVPAESLPAFDAGKRYLMRIRNGDTTGANTGRVSAVYVQVNGQEVMSTSDIGTSIASCVKVIRPAPSTTLVIGVSGTAGHYADITLFETPDPSYELRGPQTFVMGELPEEVPPGGNYTEFTDEIVRGSGDLGPYHLFVTNGLVNGSQRCSGVKVYLDGTLVVGSGVVNGNVGEYVRQVSLPNTTTSLMVRLYGNPGDQASIRFTATDATEPELTVLAPQQGLMTQQDTTTIRFRTNDQTVLDSILVNGVPPAAAGQDAAGSLWSHAAQLAQGRNEFVIRARNRAGYACDSLRTVIRDNFAPALVVDSLPEATPRTVTTSTIIVRGHWHDSTPTIVTLDGDTVSAAADSGEFALSVPLDMGSNGIHFRAVDHFGQAVEFKRFVVRQAADEPAPASDPTPSTHTPTEVAAFFDRVSFLWSGAGPVQTGVAANTMDASRVSVIRGRVLGRDVGALANVTVSVVGHAEYGQTLTRADGAFDLAVNAGAPLTLEFAKADFLPAQRTVEPALLDFVQLPDVALLGRSTRQYHVNTDTARKIVTRFESDLNGDRRLTLIFQQGTRCTLSVGAGDTTTTDFHVRAKEYTVGADGEEAMPGTLPPSSAYTYCVNLSTVEGDAMAGSGPPARVAFDRPVVTYVREFLGMPVGASVPSGSYDFATGHWLPSEDGLIVRIKGRGRSLANMDTDSLATNDDSVRNAALGFTEDEVELITNEYAVGEVLWRVRLTHFSPHDYNFNRAAVAAAQALSPGSVGSLGTLITDPDLTCACVIENENRVLGETIPIVGTPYALHYRSSRQPGDVSMRWLRIPLTGSASDTALVRVHVTVDVAGRRFSQSFSRAEASTPWEFKQWNGLDAYGRPVVGSVTATVRRGYEFKERWGVMVGGSGGNSFGNGARSSSAAWPASGNRDVGRILWTTQQVAIGAPSMAAAGLGGWTITPHHIYDPSGMGMKYRGDGTMQRGAAQFPVIKAWAGTGQGGGAAAEGGLLTTSISAVGAISFGPDRALYLANDHASDVVAATDVVMRLTDSGGVERVAGGGENSFTNGALARSVNGFKALSSAVAAPDGSVYFAESASGKDAVYRISPGTATTRKIWHYAGDPSKPFFDDSLATHVGFGQPKSLAVGTDGAVFIGAKLGSFPVILRVATDGRITRYAGGGSGSAGSNGPARSIAIIEPAAMVVDAGGNLFFTEVTLGTEDRIRRVSPDGVLSTIYSAHGIQPTCLAIGTDQQLYFGRSYAPGGGTAGVMAIYRLEPDGTTSLLVGGNGPNGNFLTQEGVYARGALFNSIRGLAFNRNGEMFITSTPGGVSKIYSETPTLVAGEIAHPSEDGRVLDVFNSGGRHLRTVDASSGLVLVRFGYDAGGRLTSVVDSNGDSTRIVRSSLGAPELIVAPRGQITTLTLNGEYLHTVTNPAGEATSVAMGPGGLLDSLTNARGQRWAYAFSSADGRLDSETEPGASSTRTLELNTSGATRTVTHESPGQRTTYYDVTEMLDGLRHRAIRYPDGSVTTQTQAFLTTSPYGEQVTTTANTGEVRITRPGRDSRFG